VQIKSAFMVRTLLSIKPQTPESRRQRAIPAASFATAVHQRGLDDGIFLDWFCGCFVLEVRKYFANKGLPFKVPLIPDNVPGHPEAQHQRHPSGLLVPNTMCLTQPPDPGSHQDL